MKVLVAPDKFKGSLSSFEVCRAIEQGLTNAAAGTVPLLFPMADGGDGFASVLQHYYHTETIGVVTVDPLGRSIQAAYQWNENEKTAIVETAAASGLVLLKQAERNPLKTSTAGTGILLQHALRKGAVKIILGLGGSATNDAGTGILSELGFSFTGKNGERLVPNGENLLRIAGINRPEQMAAVRFEIAADVKNALYGRDGAAFVYGPQKGAGEKEVEWLDRGLKHFSELVTKLTGREPAFVAGSGAAGGIAAGLMGFFDVRIKKGIDFVIEASGISDHLKDAALLITGEGKIDEQSFEGKVVGSMATMAAQHGIPVIAFCGKLELDEKRIKQLGLQRAISIGENLSMDESMRNAAESLTAAVAKELKK